MKFFERGMFAVIGGTLALAMVGLWPLAEHDIAQAARAVDAAKHATEVGIESIDPAHDGKLVTFTGRLDLTGKAQDPQFGIVVDAPKLIRRVEMYQWVYRSNQKPRWVKEWRLGSVESTGAKGWKTHPNPTPRFEFRSFGASGSVGAWEIYAALLERLTGPTTDLRIDPALEAQLLRITGPNARIQNNRLEVGADPKQSAVGDLRISFHLVNAREVTALGLQLDNSLNWYQDDGVRILEISEGSHSVQGLALGGTLANDYEDRWLLRIVFVAVIGLGFWGFFGRNEAKRALVVASALLVTSFAMFWLTFRLFGNELLTFEILMLAGAIAFVVANRRRKKPRIS